MTTLILSVIAVLALLYYFISSQYAIAVRLFLYQIVYGERAVERIVRVCSAGVEGGSRLHWMAEVFTYALGVLLVIGATGSRVHAAIRWTRLRMRGEPMSDAASHEKEDFSRPGFE